MDSIEIGAAHTENAFPEMKFGVEIEFVGVTMRQVRDALEREGIPCANPRERIHQTMDTWKVVYDGSVNYYGENGHSLGGELVSPILQGPDDVAKLRRVVEILKSTGATANRRCGLHVHVDASSLSDEEVRYVAWRYMNLEEEIATLHASWRKDCSYSKPMASTPNGRMLRQHLPLVSMANWWNREAHVNLASLVRHGTIEFRQHAGTVEAEEICNWVQWCLHFTNASRRPQSKEVFVQVDAEGTRQIEKFFKMWVREAWAWTSLPEAMRKLDLSREHTVSLVESMAAIGAPIHLSSDYIEVASRVQLLLFIDKFLRNREATEGDEVKASVYKFQPLAWQEGMPQDLLESYGKSAHA